MLEAPGVFAWRYLTGKSFDGVPRSDAGWFTRGYEAVDPHTAPRPPGRLVDEIRQDLRAYHTERRELRVRSDLGKWFRRVERDHDLR